MKKTIKEKEPVWSVTLPCLLMFSLLLSGCSYHDGKFSYFDLPNDKEGTLTKKQASEKFWASVRPKSNLSDAHYRLGLHYQRMGEHDKAIGEFTKALYNDKSYCKAFNGIAMTYDLQKRCELAHDTYEQAVKCSPGEAYVYNNYACSSLFCGNYGKGMELLQKAESLAASDTRIKNNLRIAQTIAIREGLSDYLVNEELPQSAATVEAPSIAVREAALPDPVPTISNDNAMRGSSQEASRVPADAWQPPSEKIVSKTSAREISPAPPETAKTANPSIKDGKTRGVFRPAIPAPAPKKVAIEVSNGNGTPGMAKRSADFLRGHGFTVRSVTNAKDFRFAESVIYYQEEHLQAAMDLAAVIPGAQHLEKVKSMAKPSIGVRVLLGRDLTSLNFPEDYSGIADSRQIERREPAVVTAANDMEHY